jgi:predicted permease
MNIASTIIPIFSIIILGWIANQRGFIPDTFITPANRLVYYLAIPAMIFRAISQNSFRQYFNLKVVVIAVLSMFIIFLIAWGTGKMLRLKKGHLATFIQSSFHCNIGYLALAVAYYYLGDDGFARAGIFAGFVMIFQNFLSVMILNYYTAENTPEKKFFPIISKIFGNPVIISAAAGIFFSLAGLSLPVVVSRALDILSGLALPTALLIIGATLSFRLVQKNLTKVISTTMIKLLCMPCIAFLLFYLVDIPKTEFLPAFILLASPTATITYVMAKEMKGDTDFAVAAISLNTLLSSLTFTFWLTILA